MTYDFEQVVEVFDYLDVLRESGATNMFGAASYVQQEFGCSRAESQALTQQWMITFDGGTSSIDRATTALESLNG